MNIAKQLEIMYLDYFNNFLTISRFADYYGITENEAKIIIDAGRKINENKYL